MTLRKSNRNKVYKSSLIIGLFFMCLIIFFSLYVVNILGTKNKKLPFDEIISNSSFYLKSNLPDWHTINLGKFQIQTPKEYKFYRLNGVDSYVGGITNGIDTLQFDYGLYSNTLGKYAREKFEVSTEIINEKRFKVVKAHSEIGFVGAYTQDLKNGNRLSISCENCKSLDAKIKMIRTIAF